MKIRATTPKGSSEHSEIRFGRFGSHERLARLPMQERIAGLKKLLKKRIRDDAMDLPKSPYSLMPAQAIAQRLPDLKQDSFWQALKDSIRDGAFDQRRRLYVSYESPLIRMNSDIYARLSDELFDDAAYLQKTWASIDGWYRWCPRERFAFPPSWERVVIERNLSRKELNTSQEKTARDPCEMALRQIDELETRAILMRNFDKLDQNNGAEILRESGAQYRPSLHPGSPTLKKLVSEMKPRRRGRPTKKE